MFYALIISIFLIYFPNLIIQQVSAIVINALLSQDGIKGEIHLSQESPDGDVTIQLALEFLQEGELKDLGWQIREFPVDYQVINGNERCRPERLGDVIVDLGERLGTLQLPANKIHTFIIPGGYLNISGTNGIWGRSIFLHGPRTACSTLLLREEERIAQARFYGPLAGTVIFRWFGTDEAVIFSDLLQTTEKSSDVKLHNWKLYVTDVLESAADVARDDCNALQLVFDPQDRGISSECTPSNPQACRAGDLDLRLGLLKSGSRYLARDLNLPESSDDSPRSLYLAIFDSLDSKSILACARIRRMKPKKGIVLLRGSGIQANIQFEQKTRYDVTHITTANVSNLNSLQSDWEYNIYELPVRGGTQEACKFSGNVYDPAELKENEISTQGASHDQYAAGRLHLKHGSFLNLNGSWDTFLPLFGSASIIHRSFYMSNQGDRIACGTVLPPQSFITAQATFRFPVVGRVLFRQLAGQPWTDTTVLFEYLVYADGNQNDTADLKWKIHQNAAGIDFYNWTARCLSAGPTFNPYKVITNEKEQYCFRDQPDRCALGDLSTRHSNLLAVGSKENMIVKTRRLFTDSNLPLTGLGGIVGRSLVLFHENGPKARGERLACTTITWLHRQKAVVRDWFGNGEVVGVKGKLEMIQFTEYDVTDVEVNLKGLDDNAGYHVHVAPLEIHLSFPCEDSTVYGHWNPYNIKMSDSPPPGYGTPDQYEMGDLSGKFGMLTNLSQISAAYNDTNLDLIGPLSIIGRSVVIHKAITNKRWACANVERGYAPSEARELRAIASFHHPRGYAYGYIRMTQLVYNDGSASNTAIEVKLRHPGVNDRNLTKNHNWAIYVNPVGHDATVASETIRCVAGGYRWNPYFIQLADPFNDELYQQQCGPDNPLRCHVGDLSGRLGTIDLGSKRQSFNDLNLPLEGVHSALGKSIIVFNKDKRPERYACANIEPDKDIIKYANIRKPPRFEVSQFIDRIRAIMGLPEWMLNIDNMQTKELHGGLCIQLVLHFRGPLANQLEQDFSRLLNTGTLAQPSIYFPEIHFNSKRPKTLSYRQCGTKDPTEKSRNRFNYATRKHHNLILLFISWILLLLRL